MKKPEKKRIKTKRVLKKNETPQLNREMAKLKRESNAKIKGLELKIMGQDETIRKRDVEIDRLTRHLERKRGDLSRIRKESSSKAKGLELKVQEMSKSLEKKEGELTGTRELLNQREVELKNLSEELEYKNRQLASKEMEMETYRRATEERVFRLEGRVKELEGKIGE